MTPQEMHKEVWKLMISTEGTYADNAWHSKSKEEQNVFHTAVLELAGKIVFSKPEET